MALNICHGHRFFPAAFNGISPGHSSISDRISESQVMPNEGTVIMNNSVLVTGDVTFDRHMYKGTRRRSTSLLSEGTHYQKSGGGALLLYGLVHQYEKVATSAPELTTLIPVLGVTRTRAYRHGCGVFGIFPAGDDAARRGVAAKQVWRLRESLGYGDQVPKQEAASVVDSALGAEHFVWLLDDGGLEFRQRHVDPKTDVNDEASGEAGETTETYTNPAWPSALRKQGGSAPTWILLKTAAPLASGDLWHALSPNLPRDPQGDELRDGLVVVVSADDLRCESATVSESVSWERTAADVAVAIRDNPALIRITNCRYLIVMFGVEGAMLVDCRAPAAKQCHLIFDPVNCEGDWSARIEGQAFGRLSSFVLGVLSRLPKNRQVQRGSEQPDEEVQSLIRGIKAGLSASRTLLACGHGSAEDEAESPGFPAREVAMSVISPPSCDQFEHVLVPEATSDHSMWRILEGPACHQMSQRALTLGQARLVTQFGIEKLNGVPRFEMNALKTVDRHEIESLRNIRSLIEQYSESKQSKPLPIGVFGQPGSGKSFGVKQIAKAVLGKDVPILEFNLAQLSPNDESVLIGAFHQIRDRVLEGHIPVVFWDEFDSGGLQWLSKLLAPMQDGTFLEGQFVRPVGQCVFIFAGGTSYDFQSFGPPEYSSEQLENLCKQHGLDQTDIRRRYDAEREHFRKQKGPDFKGRLTTYLNVAGPNPRKNFDWLKNEHTIDESDTGCALRRAMLLRGLARLRGTSPMNIDPALLTALLEIDFYRHGARSIEKILEQIKSRARGGRMRLSHLPPDDILNLHVNAEAFRAILNRDLGFQRTAEVIAPHIHQAYLEKAETEGWAVDPEVNCEFESLSPHYQDINVAAAARMPVVLGAVGLRLAPASEVSETDASVNAIIAEKLEVLAEAEHLRWMEYHFRNGWTYAQERNNESKQHPSLKPYPELTSKEQQKDRDQVTGYPDFANMSGYSIVSK